MENAISIYLFGLGSGFVLSSLLNIGLFLYFTKDELYYYKKYPIIYNLERPI